MKNLILLTLLLIIGAKSFSQDMYRTQSGYVLVYGGFNDSSFVAESHRLIINYNSKSKLITGKINTISITSGIPYLDNLLMENSGSTINLSALIPEDFLAWDHKKYELNVPLEISFNSTTVNIIAKMEFTHNSKINPGSCIMEAIFKLDLTDFKIEIPAKLDSIVTVQFMQLILRQGKQ